MVFDTGPGEGRSEELRRVNCFLRSGTPASPPDSETPGSEASPWSARPLPGCTGALRLRFDQLTIELLSIPQLLNLAAQRLDLLSKCLNVGQKVGLPTVPRLPEGRGRGLGSRPPADFPYLSRQDLPNRNTPEPRVVGLMRIRPFSSRLALAALLVLASSSCATLEQFAALRNVDFALDRVSDLRLAGIDIGSIRSFDDLSFIDAGRLVLAVSRNELPMAFQLHLLAENPADNATDARLLQMDWTLLLQDRETLSGLFDREVLLPPGQPTDVPLTIGLNLIDFFDGSAQDLFELALSIADQGGTPKEIALRATPVVQTPLGPIRYPQPITIISREVGQ